MSLEAATGAVSDRPFGLRHHPLTVGIALYAVSGTADIYLTLHGIGANLELEGNPILRFTMGHLGFELGLLVQKAVTAAATIWIAVVFGRAIRTQAPWIWKIPASQRARDWVRRKDRSWIALIPLFAAAGGQVLAVASWLSLQHLL